MAAMDNHSLARTLAEFFFFLDSLREDAGDVDNWCSRGRSSADDIVDGIKKHLGLSI